MWSALVIVLSVIIYLIKIVKEGNKLTLDKWGEIFVSFFVFTNSIYYGFTLYEMDVVASIAAGIRIEIYMLLIPFFLVVIGRRNNWTFPSISWQTVLFIVLFCAINILNPSNINSNLTVLGIVRVFLYLAFLYILISSTTSHALLRGIYNGLIYTVILQGILSFAFFVGFTEVATFFRDYAYVRSADRPGAVGTFAHPNPFAAYLSMCYCFFLSCYLLGYRKKKSLIWSILTILVLIPSFSRTAMLSILVSTLIVISIKNTLNSSIFSVKNIFQRILPLIVVAVALVLFTPLKDSFVGSNLDEMMMARLLHYYCGWIIFTKHPIIGVGFNTHVEYMIANFNFKDMAFIDPIMIDFLYNNSIHNVFFICIAELGLLGLAFIIYFFVKRFRSIKGILRSDCNLSFKIFSLTSIGILCCFLSQGMGEPSFMGTPLRELWLLFFVISGVKMFRYDNDISKIDKT